jgi:membrane protein YdbS with pleckstrin-like domain
MSPEPADKNVCPTANPSWTGRNHSPESDARFSVEFDDTSADECANLRGTRPDFMSEEKILFQGSSSPVINLGTFLLCGIILLASVIFSFIISLWLLLLAGIVLIYAAVQWLLIRCRVYEITTERIRVTNGILTRTTEELELYRVQDTTLVQPLIERLLGLGNIRLTTNDASMPSLEIEAIPGARELREALRQSIEDCRDRKRVRVTELE